MSLRVWLPLTKDLRNQGLDNVSAMVNGTTSFTAGKLGQALNCNGSSYWSLPGLTVGTVASIACWSKTYTNSKMQWVLESSVSDKLNLFEYNIYTLNTGDSNENPFQTDAGANIDCLHDGVWHHFVVTWDGSVSKLYIDGTYRGKAKTYKSPASGNTTRVLKVAGGYGNGHSYDWNGAINDFRLYDHCLSPMEVKELAKGLVLHYPLNRGGWGQNNILLNTGFESRYTQSTGWDTTKNGTQLANSWGGYNTGVTNQATVYHAHLKEFNGEWVYEYIRTANESWLGIAQSGLQSKLTAGETYTFSWEEYHVDGTNRVGTGLYYYKTGATSANFHLGIQQAVEITRVLGKWQKYTYTFIAPSDADWSKNMSWYVYGHYNGNGTFYVRHIKLEKGSVATPWCPNASDALATTMGLNGTIEYDCSGFCNNGTRIGTFTWTSNTSKYAVSQVFNGSNNAIQTPSLPTMITDKNYTIAVWIYKTVIGSKDYQTIYGGPSGFEIEARNGGANETKFVPWNWGKPMASYELNEWNHCVFVHSDSDCKIYLNGEYIATGTAKTYNPTGNYFIGAWNTATQQNFDGLMSDFRIYATALSAEDVKSLYQNSAYIDSSGNVYGAVHSEV